MSRLFFKGSLPPDDEFKYYVKKGTTRIARVEGPFSVDTREGLMHCEDGYLALDNNDDPYPIAKDVFDTVYEPAD